MTAAELDELLAATAREAGHLVELCTGHGLPSRLKARCRRIAAALERIRRHLERMDGDRRRFGGALVASPHHSLAQGNAPDVGGGR